MADGSQELSAGFTVGYQVTISISTSEASYDNTNQKILTGLTTAETSYDNTNQKIATGLTTSEQTLTVNQQILQLWSEAGFPSHFIPSEFTVRRSLSQSLKCGFFLNNILNEELLAEFVVNQTSASLNFKGEFVVRYSSSLELQAGLWTPGQTESLPAELIVRNANTYDLLNKLTVRHSSSRELKGGMELRRSSSFEIPSEFISRQAGSQNLGGRFDSGQNRRDLLAGFMIKQITSEDLQAGFGIQDKVLLKGIFTARQSSSENLFGKFDVGQDSQPLYGKFDVGQGSRELKAGFRPAQEIYNVFGKFEVAWWERLKGSINIRITARGNDLLSKFEVAQNSEGLLGKINVKQPASTTLKGKMKVGDSSSQELLGEFISRQNTSRDLKAGFYSETAADSGELLGTITVRQATSRELKGGFDAQVTRNLLAGFFVNNANTQDLLGGFSSRHLMEAYRIIVDDIWYPWLNYWHSIGTGWISSPDREYDTCVDETNKTSGNNSFRIYTSRTPKGSNSLEFGWTQEPFEDITPTETEALPGEFIVRHASSQELKAGFEVGQNRRDLLAEMVLRRSTSQELSSQAVIRRSDSQELLGELISRQASNRELKAGFFTQIPTEDLLASMVSRQSTNVSFKGTMEIRRSSSQALKGVMTLIPIGSEEVPGAVSIRRSDSQELRGVLDIRRSTSEELKGGCEVVNASSQNLLGQIIVRHSDSQELLAGFSVRRSTSSEFKAVLSVRHADNQDLLMGFITRPAGSQNLGASFTIRHLTESAGQIIIDDGFHAWTTNVIRIGTGFIAGPTWENDASVKTSGINSLKIEATRRVDEAEAIIFGWRAFPYRSILVHRSGEVKVMLVVRQADSKMLKTGFDIAP